MDETNKIQMRKRNMKLFPLYKRLSWDYLFFYTINFLFLTQVKHINAADVVLIDSFYYLFSIIAQMPATFIIEFFGRKNSIIIGNVLSCVYMILIICSQNLFHLIIAEILSGLSFAIKESAEPSLLSESIPPTKYKSRIFAKITEKGMANYYIINAISTVIAGILYEVNPYIPICLSLSTLLLVTFLSTLFIEPLEKTKKEKKESGNQLIDIQEAFKFVIKSERVKGLILFSAIIMALFSILTNYEISLLEDLEISASFLGILAAMLQIVSGIFTKKQEQFHNKFQNKSLTIIGLLCAISCLFSGILGIAAEQMKIMIIFIVGFYTIKYICLGIYNPLIEKYLSNFTNEEIDTKIFIANNLLKSITSAIFGIFASFLLDRMKTAYCMIIVGIIFFILMILVNRFMKKRVGLKPEEYSKEEIKYDRLQKYAS